ncbi:NmrA family NAD(P)-binding protein [Oryzobacter sp. R7]|uniref:NmrA family NAD(P)-binding protein n=1 Tax=Oryzobacter faecalis TaxID=3388656 RepID=UPI00398C8BD0
MSRTQEATGSGAVAVHDPVAASGSAAAQEDPRPVVVLGAAGKTGRAVAAALTARGVPVRAAVRAGRESAALPGAEPVVVDLVTGTGLDSAFTGARAAYHLAPNVHPDEVAMAQRVAEAATAAGLPHLTFHSVLHPHDARMPHHVRKGEAEAVLRRGVPGSLVVLRPSAYHQNLLVAALTGEIAVPYSLEAPFTTVDLADVADAAAVVLLDPSRDGEAHDLCGPEVLTTARMAEVAAEVLGRPVTARRVDVAEWRAGPGAGLSPQARDVLAAMFAAYDDGGLVGDPAALTTLLGRRLTTWAQALTRTDTDR